MSTLSVDTIQGKTTASTIAFPSGTPIQYLSDDVNSRAGSNINVTWSCTNGNSAQYGSGIANRTYVEASSLTLTPKTSSSKVAVWGTVDWGNFGGSSNGAHGVVITLDDTSMVDTADFPYYANSSVGSYISYWPSMHIHGTFTLSDSNAHVFRLRPFGYSEGASFTPRYRGYKFAVMEITG